MSTDADLVASLHRQHRDALAARLEATGMHHDAETLNHLRGTHPIRVVKTHEGKIVAWAKTARLPVVHGGEAWRERLEDAGSVVTDGPGGRHGVYHLPNGSYGVLPIGDDGRRIHLGGGSTHDTQAGAVAAARRLSLTRPVVRVPTPMSPRFRMAKKTTTTQDMSGTPKTPAELKALKVKHTLTAAGKPVVTQGALTDALNRRGRRATRGMSNTRLGVHLLQAGAHDVAAGVHDTAMRDWYGPHARHMEHGFHRMFGYADHPDDSNQVFAKVLVGLTSPGNNPNQNVDTAVRMLHAAGGDVAQIPHGNAPKFREWLTKHVLGGGTIPHSTLGHFGGDEFGRPIEDIPVGDHHAAAAWAHKHGYASDKDVAYYGIPALLDTKRGKVTHLQRQGKWVSVARTPSHTVVGGRIEPRRSRPLPPGDAKVHMPILDALGRLQPKKWVAYAKSLGVGLAGLQSLIAAHGREGAAKWLTAEHDPADVVAARKAHVSPHGTATVDYLPPGEKLAGFLMFGPKIGSFMANIHDSQRLGKYLTADQWFARWFRRHQGTLEGKKEPITKPQRKSMYEAAQALQRHTGADSIAQLQAILWGAEQALYRSYHQKADSGNLLTATQRAMRRHFGLATGEGDTKRPSGHYRVDKPTTRRVESTNLQGLL